MSRPRIKGTHGTKYYEFPEPRTTDKLVKKLFRHNTSAWVRSDPKRGIDLFFVEADHGDEEDISILDIPQIPTGSREISEEDFMEAVG